MGDVLIPSLMTGDCTDHICVRASRLWEFYDLNDEKKLLHADLVLIDEEMYPNAYARLKALIKEGCVYNIACFWVKKSPAKYKPVTNDFMISLSSWTTVEEVVEIPPVFPILTYSLTPIEQVPSRKGYTEYYTDVIGIVTAVSDIFTIRATGKENDVFKRVVTIRNSSNASVDVVLWGERASSFPAEQMHTDGGATPQVVLFVGTLPKTHSTVTSLSGNSPCKWYINPDIPETKALLSSIGDMIQPVRWDQQTTPVKPTTVVEPKRISEIKDLNPFRYKKTEFLVTVTIKKIDNSWWYNSCEKCVRTTKPHGDLYKCTEPTCGHIGKPVQRYKLSIIAGDETGDTDFIMFGRWVQRLTKKTADTLIAQNPRGFIPNEITRLLEKVFKWNVSFTQNTISSSKVCFQVNAIVGEINDIETLLPVTPSESQSSSLMISQGAGSSMQRTPQKSVAIPYLSQPTVSYTSHASNTTPTKTGLIIPEPQVTPQSDRHANEDQITPTKEKEITLPPNADTLTSAGALPDKSSTKSQQNTSKKRTRQSPNQNVVKELFAKDDNANDDSGVPANVKTRARRSPNKRVGKPLFAEQQAEEPGDDSGGGAATADKDSPSSAA